MQLSDYVTAGRPLSFLAGAGISCNAPSNIPMARPYVEAVIDVLPMSESVKASIKDLLESNTLRFEQFMEELQVAYDYDLHILDLMQFCRAPNALHFFLARSLASGHTVLTPNFDSLIEEACSRLGVVIRTAYDAESTQDALRESGQPVLWKIHGTLQDVRGHDCRKSIVATMRRVGAKGEGLCFEPGMRAVIEERLNATDLIVLGYSGSDDYDIVPALAQISTRRRILWVWHRASVSTLTVCRLDDLGQREEMARALSAKLQALGHWHADQLSCVVGNTSVIVAQIHKALFGPEPELDLGAPFLPPPWFFREWAYQYALESWKTQAFLGSVYDSMGDYSQARACLSAAAKIADEFRDEAAQHALHRAISRIYLLEDNFEEALRHLRALTGWIERCERKGLHSQVAWFYRDMAICHDGLGEATTAEQILQTAKPTSGSADDAGIQFERAILLFERGEKAQGVDLARNALKIHRQNGNLESVVRCLCALAREHALRRGFADANLLLDEATRISALLNNSSLLVTCREVRAEAYWNVGLLGKAFDELRALEGLYGGETTSQ